MKRPKRYFLMYLFTLPWDLVAWLIVLLMWLFWGTKLHWLEGLWFEFKLNSWPTRTWYRRKINGVYEMYPVELQATHGMWKTWGATSLGHAGFGSPGAFGGQGIDTDTEYHEHIHTEQQEAVMVGGFFVQAVHIGAQLIQGQTPNWILHLVLWTLSWLIFYSSSMFVAWLRGEPPYKGNVFEESAYSQERSEAEHV